MNKKHLIPLLIIPLVTSCNGFSCSKEEALTIVNTISDYIKTTTPFEEYCQKRETVLDDVVETTQTVYSSSAKYYHTWTISTQSNGRVNEYWKFVMNYEDSSEPDESKKMKKFIFDVTRKITPSTVDEDLDKQYTPTYEPYSDELWAKYAKDFEDNLLIKYTDALTHAKTLLEENDSLLSLKSSNANSFYLLSSNEVEGSTKSNSYYEISFKNNQLLSLRNETSDKNKTNYSFAYSAGDIYYPAFKITIAAS